MILPEQRNKRKTKCPKNRAEKYTKIKLFQWHELP